MKPYGAEANSFRPERYIEWEERAWLPWELCIYYSFTKRWFGFLLTILLIPVCIVVLPVLPLITVLSMKTMRVRGPHLVGVSEVEQLLKVPSVSNATGVAALLPARRLRIFYPAAAAEERRGFLWSLLPRSRRQPWLPRGEFARRYAEAHLGALGVGGKEAPLWLRPLIAPFAWVLYCVTLPYGARWDAPAASPPEGGWPLTLFSHVRRSLSTFWCPRTVLLLLVVLRHTP